MFSEFHENLNILTQFNKNSKFESSWKSTEWESLWYVGIGKEK